MMDEQQLSMQQGLDQFGAFLRDLAPQVAGYYRALVEHGVPKRAALDLTAEFQQLWLARLLGVPEQRP